MKMAVSLRCWTSPKLLLLFITCAVLLQASQSRYQAGTLCYQCSYTRSVGPPHYSTAYVAYDSYHRQRVTLVRPLGPGPFQQIQIQRGGAGGWKECDGYLTEPAASRAGVDVWRCPGNCYTQLDISGNLVRGCYSGEYGINQHLMGCYIQQDQIYCFCEGDRCNRHHIPYYYYYLLYNYGPRPPFGGGAQGVPPILPPPPPDQGFGPRDPEILPLQQGAPQDAAGDIPPEIQKKLPTPVDEGGNIRIPLPNDGRDIQ